jgi:hypothetical protein
LLYWFGLHCQKTNKVAYKHRYYSEKWIFTHRQKTETAFKIPILPVTQMIIDKYADHPKSNNEDRLLPILTNQKMNVYLKEIAGVCEIEKELTFYMPDILLQPLKRLQMEFLLKV